MAPTTPEIQELLEHAVYQQLFNLQHGNRIMGKNPENTMQITGVSQLLDLFINEIKQNLTFIDQQQIDQFIQIFEHRFKIDLTKSKAKIQNNVDEMLSLGSIEGQEVMFYYTILTKMLESIREYSYKTFGLSKIQDTLKKQTSSAFSKRSKAALQKMAALNHPDVSILYNLSFIAHLAEAYHSAKLITTTKRLVSLRVNRIVQKIKD